MAPGFWGRRGWRRAAALGLLGVGVTIHYLGGSFPVGMLIWFVVAVGIGTLVARPWGLLLTAVPWPLGVGIELLTGRYAFLGEAWQVAAGWSVLAGVCGATLGLASIPFK